MGAVGGAGSGSSSERLWDELATVMAVRGDPLASADRLCEACVDRLRVDGAAISFVLDGTTRGTFGSSGAMSRKLDELQYTFGEGPCLDAVNYGRPVLVPDLDLHDEGRWPAFAGAVRREGVRAVFAMPVTVAASPVGALDLFRNSAGPLSEDEFGGALRAADLASLPLLDMLHEARDTMPVEEGDPWAEIASLERVEVYQATGMLMAQLHVSSTEALVRLRAYAYAHDRTASEVAWAIIERRLVMDSDESWHGPGAGGSAS